MKGATFIGSTLALLAVGCAADPWEQPEGKWFLHPEVLRDPVRVREVVGEDLLILEDGRNIQLTKSVPRLEGWIGASNSEVELPAPGSSVDGVFVRRHMHICGLGVPDEVWFRHRIGSR